MQPLKVQASNIDRQGNNFEQSREIDVTSTEILTLRKTQDQDYRGDIDDY